MSRPFTIKNSGEKEINDVRHSEVFQLEGYSYKISIKPKCKFWRIGLRFSVDRRGGSWSTSHRYNDTQIQHLEVCVGVRPNGDWQQPNLIQLQQYNIQDAPDILHSCDAYEEFSEVSLSVRPKTSGQLEISLSSIHCRTYSTEVNIVFAQAFTFFAWADWTDFELECQIKPEFTPLKIDLKTIKALTNQKSSITVEKLAIFFGGNNSGKTSVLVGACNAYMNKHYSSMDYLGLNRVYTSSKYNYELEALDEYQRADRQEENRKRRSGNTIGQNELFDWMEELALQDEQTRLKILEWVNTNFEPWNFQEVKKGKFVTGLEAKINNLEPLDQGTGARAVLPIMIQLYNPNVNFLAIDEPELGLEPRMQKLVFRAIKDATEGRNGFPMKRVLLATHSHLFLDRTNLSNNFSTKKSAGKVSIAQVISPDELQDATFKLLGSNPSDLFFPSNIIIVEGVTDCIFLNSIYKIGREQGLFSSEHIVFHYLEGFDKLQSGSEGIVQMLKTQTYSPIYKGKICGLFDKPSKPSKTIDKIRNYFHDHDHERFVILPKPAIEYFYPLSIINVEFKDDLDEYSYESKITKYLESVQRHPPFAGEFLGRQLTKVEFARLIADGFTKDTLKEIDRMILNLLEKADGLAYS